MNDYPKAATPTFTDRINGRQILVHLIAALFIMYGCYVFSFLYSTALVKSIRQSGATLTLKDYALEGKMTELSSFIFWRGVSDFIGLLIAFIISLLISIRKHWHWINTVIVLVLGYLSGRSHWPVLFFRKGFLLIPAKIFDNITLEFLVNGWILISIGLLIFLLKAPNRFIERKNKANNQNPVTV